MQRLLLLYEEWNKAAPGAHRAAKLAEWEAKLEAANPEADAEMERDPDR
jgi:hypothetical protein